MCVGLPKKAFVPNPHNIPVHNQGRKNNCTAHSNATLIEYTLSGIFKERVIVDVDDLWLKQKKFGTATEQGGDTLTDSVIVAARYGIKFETDSGKKGIFYPGLSTKSISIKSRGIWIYENDRYSLKFRRYAKGTNFTYKRL
jgi:hypothetical protein